MLEPSNNVLIEPSPAGACGEQRRTATLRQGESSSVQQMSSQFLCEFWANWHEPGLKKLGVADSYDLVDQIDVPQSQFECFADAQSASI